MVPRSMLGRMTVCLIALTLVVTPAKAQRPDSTLLRPTTVIVKISNDPNSDYNGTYRALGVSTKCGLADYGYPHRLISFAVMFPDDTTTIAVTSVNFDADTLKRSEEHTSELQSQSNLVCRLLLEKKKLP